MKSFFTAVLLLKKQNKMKKPKNKLYQPTKTQLRRYFWSRDHVSLLSLVKDICMPSPGRLFRRKYKKTATAPAARPRANMAKPRPPMDAATQRAPLTTEVQPPDLIL